MPYLSIIVPTFREENTIEDFLVALQRQTKTLSAYQVIISDSSDDTTKSRALAYAQSTSWSCFSVIDAPKGRAKQMNSGASYAGRQVASLGEQYFLFVHSDTLLPNDLEQWWGTVTSQRPDWGFFRVGLSGRAWVFRVIEGFMNWRSLLTCVATGDQCLFVRGAVWEQLGGFCEIPLMEDVDITKRLRKMSRPFVGESPVVTSSRRWEKRGVAKTVLLMWALRLGYFLGVSPKRLAQAYRNE